MMSRLCCNERRSEKTKINHEETKNTKVFCFFYVFFISSWLIFRGVS